MYQRKEIDIKTKDSEVARNEDLERYLVVSYKADGINTYNVFVIDIDTKLIKFWFECYQLYESPIKGFLLSSNDFMMLSKDGIMMINLGNIYYGNL